MKLAFKDLKWTDDAPKSELEDWLRWYAFESECHILWSEVAVSELGSTSAIQLVRSLERALEKCRLIGAAEWDLYDLGWGSDCAPTEGGSDSRKTTNVRTR